MLRVHELRPSPPPMPEGTGPRYNERGVRIGRPPAPLVMRDHYGGAFPSRNAGDGGMSASRASLHAGGWYGVGRTITEAIQELTTARESCPNP